MAILLYAIMPKTFSRTLELFSDCLDSDRYAYPDINLLKKHVDFPSLQADSPDFEKLCAVYEKYIDATMPDDKQVDYLLDIASKTDDDDAFWRYAYLQLLKRVSNILETPWSRRLDAGQEQQFNKLSYSLAVRTVMSS